MQDKKSSIKFIEKCYKLYEQKLYQVAYNILRDSGLAEDAVQDAFLKLMKSDIYFADASSDDCKRYIITVIKHSSINIYNKKKKEKDIVVTLPKVEYEEVDVEKADELIGENISFEVIERQMNDTKITVLSAVSDGYSAFVNLTSYAIAKVEFTAV